MSLTNDAVITRVKAAAGAISLMPDKELLAIPTEGFVSEYNRTREAFLRLKPTMKEAAPPEVLGQCRYVELLAYFEQLRGFMEDDALFNGVAVI
jgi:hypothetical protein